LNYWVHFPNQQYAAAWAGAQKIHVEGLLQIKREFPKHPEEYIKRLFAIEKTYG
jgi:hypothetical protein